MVMSPVFGALSERFPRKLMIAAGVALWSLATAAAAWSHSFGSFLLARALVGVGEAAYATLSPPLLSDFYPPHRRNRVLTRFFVAIPVGSALGFALGGFLGARWGWRAAFLFCGLPGLLAALATLTIQEPRRGALDDRRTEAATMAWPQALKSLSKNREYAWSVAGYTAVTFASGALADWFPAFLVRHRGMALEEAGSLVGAAAVLGGLGGTVVGGYLGDRLKGWLRQPYYAVSALSMALASVLAAVALLVTSKAGVAVTMILAQFFMWFYNGPINARIVNAVPSALRARALSLSILCIHLLGDALSPTVVGLVADAVGLHLGIACVPLAMAVGAGLWGHAWKTLPEEGV
jgi:MFS family permease